MPSPSSERDVHAKTVAMLAAAVGTLPADAVARQMLQLFVDTPFGSAPSEESFTKTARLTERDLADVTALARAANRVNRMCSALALDVAEGFAEQMLTAAAGQAASSPPPIVS